MVKLTEDMIVARTRVSDMGHVKKLNCWGAELTDISILRRLVNVEVLSLSVNGISTLEDISYCKHLQELYIRKNKIPDISEICWLADLPKLKNLWLEENPCSEGGAELYRLTVIKTLPQLQKLDNTAVSSEEMADAMRRGLDLVHPLEGGGTISGPGGQGSSMDYEDERRSIKEDERKISRNHHQQQQYYEQDVEYTRRESVQSPSRRVSNQVIDDQRLQYSQYPVTRAPEDDLRRMSIREENTARYSEEPYRPQRSSYSGPPPSSSDLYSRGQSESRGGYEPRGPYNQYQQDFTSRSASVQLDVEEGGSRATTPLEETPTRGPRSTTPLVRQGSRAELARVREDERGLSSLELGGEGRRSGLQSLDPMGVEGRRSGVPSLDPMGVVEAEGSQDSRVSSRQMSQADMMSVVSQHYNSTYRQVDQQLESAHQLLAARRSTSPLQRPYPVRPKNRNSNVLSAILCLIKEIDGPSLEVVEMAVRCRMEELDD